MFHTGTPDYVDVSSGAAGDGMFTFPEKAAADSWVDGDIVFIAVTLDDNNYSVWAAEWDETNEYLLLSTAEESVGTLTDNDIVTTTSTITSLGLDHLIFEPQLVEVSGTTHTTLADNKGRTHRVTGASAVTVTLDDSMPVGWHAVFVQEGAGTVSFARAGTDTINGGAGSVDISDQWKSAYVYQATEGAWVVVA